MPRDTDKPPGLTQLAEAVQATRRRRNWTAELPSLARRAGVSLTLGGVSLGTLALLVKLFTFGADISDRVEAKVNKAIEAHNVSNTAHTREFDKLEKLNQRTYDAMLELRTKVRDLEQALAETRQVPRRRRR